MLYSLTRNVHSKDEYFDEHLKKERDQSNTIKQKLFQLKEEASNNLDTHDRICHRCWFSVYRLDYDCMPSYILKNNKRITKSFDCNFLYKYNFNDDNFRNTISIALYINFICYYKFVYTS